MRLGLTTRERAERHGISPGTAANQRSTGTGPPYVKAAGRIIYPLDLLEAWERANLHGVPAGGADTVAA